MTDQFIAASPGYTAIVVTHFTDGREPLVRSAPIIGWRPLTDTCCNEYEIIPVFLGEQADQTSRDWMYYIGIAQQDGRVWWSGEFFADQTKFMLASLAAETKRRARVANVVDESTPYLDEIGKILGLSPAQVVRNNLDMDLCDDCRTLEADGVDLSDEAAVRQAFTKNFFWHADYPRYVDALVYAAKGRATLASTEICF